MSDDDTKVPLPDLENSGDVQMVPDAGPLAPSDAESVNRGAADLEAVFDVPVQVSAVLGRAHMEVGNLLKLGPGAVLELDRKVGEGADSNDQALAVLRSGRGAADLEAVFDVPVKVSAVLGRAHMEVGNLLKLGPGAVLELDRKVGEAIDIYVNNRLVARGEVVLVEDKLGVTMTEIIKADHN